MPQNPNWLGPSIPFSASHEPNPRIPTDSHIGPITGPNLPNTGVFGPTDVADLFRRMGLEPDLSQLDPTHGSAEAVTRFLTGGVPDRALRELATTKFLEEASKLDPKVGQAAEYMANKYPRVAAHTQISSIPKVDPNNAAITHITGAPGDYLAGIIPQRIPVEFSNIGLAQKPARVRNTLAHEMTHVAQALGDKDINSKYKLAEKITGYRDNPYEITAKRAGLNAEEDAPRFIPMRDPPEWRNTEVYTAPRGLARIAEQAQSNPGYFGTKKTKADELYQKILAGEMLQKMLNKAK